MVATFCDCCNKYHLDNDLSGLLASLIKVAKPTRFGAQVAYFEVPVPLKASPPTRGSSITKFYLLSVFPLSVPGIFALN